MNIPLQVIDSIEIDDDWKDVCDKKHLLSFIAKYLIGTIDQSKLDKVIISDEKPRGADKSKIWVKTSWPFGLGFLANGEWQIIYTDYPQNTPFLSKEIYPLRDFLRKLSSDDLVAYGITDTKPDAKDRMYWYIFEPEPIEA